MTSPQVLRSGAWNTKVPVPPDESLGNSRFGSLAISLLSLLTLDTGSTFSFKPATLQVWGQQQLPELLHLFESVVDSKVPGLGIAGWMAKKRKDANHRNVGWVPYSSSMFTFLLYSMYIYLYYIYIFFSRCGEKRKASPFLFVNSPTSVRSHGEGVVETLANCLGFQRCQLEACQGGSDC